MASDTPPRLDAEELRRLTERAFDKARLGGMAFWSEVPPMQQDMYDRVVLHALSLAQPAEGGSGWRPIQFTEELAAYVVRYGGRCRDCADHDGVCPGGLPCDPSQARDAVLHVVQALNYGFAHGYLPSAPTQDNEA